MEEVYLAGLGLGIVGIAVACFGLRAPWSNCALAGGFLYLLAFEACSTHGPRVLLILGVGWALAGIWIFGSLAKAVFVERAVGRLDLALARKRYFAWTVLGPSGRLPGQKTYLLETSGARKAILDGNWDAVEALFEGLDLRKRRLKIQPEFWRIACRVLADRGRWDDVAESIDWYSRHIFGDSWKEVCLLFMPVFAIAGMKAGFDDCLAELRKGFDPEPEHILAYWRARCLAAEGNHLEAIKLLGRIAATPGLPAAWMNEIRRRRRLLEAGEARSTVPESTKVRLAKAFDSLRPGPTPWATYALLGAHVAVFAALSLAEGSWPFHSGHLSTLVFVAPLAANGEPWRSVTYTFAPEFDGLWYVAIAHLVAVGMWVEKRSGPVSLLGIYAVCAAGSAIMAGMVFPDRPLMGLTGVIFGLWAAELPARIRLPRQGSPVERSMQDLIQVDLIVASAADLALGANFDPAAFGALPAAGFAIGLVFGVAVALPRRWNWLIAIELKKPIGFLLAVALGGAALEFSRLRTDFGRDVLSASKRLARKGDDRVAWAILDAALPRLDARWAAQAYDELGFRSLIWGEIESAAEFARLEAMASPTPKAHFKVALASLRARNMPQAQEALSRALNWPIGRRTPYWTLGLFNLAAAAAGRDREAAMRFAMALSYPAYWSTKRAMAFYLLGALQAHARRSHRAP